MDMPHPGSCDSLIGFTFMDTELEEPVVMLRLDVPNDTLTPGLLK